MLDAEKETDGEEGVDVATVYSCSAESSVVPLSFVIIQSLCECPRSHIPLSSVSAFTGKLGLAAKFNFALKLTAATR